MSLHRLVTSRYLFLQVNRRPKYMKPHIYFLTRKVTKSIIGNEVNNLVPDDGIPSWGPRAAPGRSFTPIVVISNLLLELLWRSFARVWLWLAITPTHLTRPFTDLVRQLVTSTSLHLSPPRWSRRQKFLIPSLFHLILMVMINIQPISSSHFPPPPVSKTQRAFFRSHPMCTCASSIRKTCAGWCHTPSAPNRAWKLPPIYRDAPQSVKQCRRKRQMSSLWRDHHRHLNQKFYPADVSLYICLRERQRIFKTCVLNFYSDDYMIPQDSVWWLYHWRSFYSFYF